MTSASTITDALSSVTGPSTLMMSLSKCPVCHSPERSIFYSFGPISVQQCGTCGLCYLDPCLSTEAMKRAYESEQTLKNFHGFHEGYYEYGEVAQPSRTRAEFIRELEMVETLLGPKSERRLLDVGYGNGFFLAMAKSRGWFVDGIDSSETNKKVAKRKFGLDLRTDTLEQLVAEEKIYDVVSFLDVVEHLSDPHAFLKNAGELLKPGGLFLVAVPNKDNFLTDLGGLLHRISRRKIHAGLNKFYIQEHVSYFNLLTLRKLFDLHGYDCRSYFYSNPDLKKYKLSPVERVAGEIVLLTGRILGRQNRLIAAFQKKGGSLS